MKFPSLHKLAESSLVVIKRFPLEVLMTCTGTVCVMLLIEQNFGEEDKLVRLAVCSNLGLVLFLSISVFTEAGNNSRKAKTILQGLAALLLVFIYFMLNPIAEEVNGFRFGFLFVAFHLLVAFAPFIRRGSVEGFWEYNKQLFIRILTAGLYSSFLYAGLAIAIGSADALFSLDIDGEIYAHLLCLVFGIFNTVFFLAGVPSNWKELEESQQYPKGLKIFTQFVLIPLASVYLCILLAYEGKLIVEWSLPKGLVSSLVVGYAVYGILSILLVHPIRFDEGNRWIRTFSRLFYMLLVPLIVLLAIAVWIRVDQYGITESRYILIVLSLWLTGITIYFLSSRLQNIQVIPVSLCLVALLATWGPQSASSISRRSQVNRLIDFFEKNNAFKNEKLVPVSTTVQSHEAAETLNFIVSRYGTNPLKEFVSVNLDSITYAADTIKLEYTRENERMNAVRAYLGLQFDYSSYSYPNTTYFNAQAEKHDSIPIHQFRYFIGMTYPNYDYSDSMYQWKADSTRLTFNGLGRIGEFNLLPVFKTIVEKSNNGNRSYAFEMGEVFCEDTTGQMRLVVRNISFRRENESKYVMQSCEGYLFIK